jgi:hypothetical protein
MIFGRSYAGYPPVVLPLAIATAAVTLHATYVNIDAGIGRLRTAVALGLGGVVCLGGAVLAVAHGAEVDRAAWAAAAVAVALAVVHTGVEVRRFGRILGRRSLIAILFAGALAAPCALIPKGPLLLGAIALGTCVYVGVALWSGMLDLGRR